MRSAADAQPARPAATGAPEGVASARSNVVLAGVARSLTWSTGLYTAATALAIPVGLISTIVTLWYLRPAQFGELGLLMVLASFLTVIYNIGLLHGTFLWVYGSSGDGADDLEIDGVARATVAGQRVAMGTGLITTLMVVSCGTAVFFIFARPTADLLLGNTRDANLIGWTAISGACGSIFRLTVNVFRFERRPGMFALATAARPVGILICSTTLVVCGYGLWGALMGTVLPTIACALLCMLATRRSYSLAFSPSDLHQIVARGATVVAPVVALFVVHSCDLYLVAASTHGAALGVYRLASRLGSPPSYFASAVVMSWGPLERSSLVTAAFHQHGQDRVRSYVNTYYLLVGLSICVGFVCFSRLLIVIAPPAYHQAADVVPLVALGFVLYGGYIVLLRTTRPDRLLLWYAITAVLAAVVFIGTGLWLIPIIGIYGAPLALIVGMLAAMALVVWRNRQKPEPLLIQWRRITAGLIVAGSCSALALAGSSATPALTWISAGVAALAFLPLLVLSGAVPRWHLPLLWSILAHRPATPLVISATALPAGEQAALAAFRARTLDATSEPLEYARFTRALRRLGGIGQPTGHDLEIGRYLASQEPEAIRDFTMNELIDEHHVDPYELYRLDQLAKLAGRRGDRHLSLPVVATRSPSAARRVLARARTAADRTLLDPAGNLLPAGLADADPLDLVRALRALRRTIDGGRDSASDFALARALSGDRDAELDPQQRAELRRMRRSLSTRGGPSRVSQI